MLVIRCHHEEFIMDSCDICICYQIFHLKSCQIPTAIAWCCPAGECMHAAIFFHVSNVSGMKPDPAIRMLLKHIRCGFFCIVAEHNTRAAFTNFSKLIISQFFLCSRFEDADHAQRKRNTNITVCHFLV